MLYLQTYIITSLLHHCLIFVIDHLLLYGMMTGIRVCSTCESNKDTLNLGTEQAFIFSVPPKDHQIHNREIFVILSKRYNRQTTVLDYELFDRWTLCAMHLHRYKTQNPITIEHFMPIIKKLH